MSFGWSGSDVFLLAQLAWNTVQNSRKACGEYDELTREALRLHAVLQRLEQEVAKPESPINRPGETSKEQLQRVAIDCEVVLKQLDKIVAAYASLSEEKRSARKIWQRVRFGNGQMADLGDLRSKVMLYTSEMLLYLNLISMSTVGRIEQRMDKEGGVLRDIKVAVEKKTAHTVLCGDNREGSILTTYADDDTKFWRGLRRDLIKDGLPSAAIHKHKHLIKKYVKELAARGILDDESSKENDQQQHAGHEEFEITGDQELANDRNVNLKTHDRNASVQPLDNHIEESLGDSSNSIIAEGIESESPHADPRVTASRNMKEQSQTNTDNVGIRSGAKIESQIDHNSSDTLEPADSERGSRKNPPVISVPSRLAKMPSRTSENKPNTSRRDTATAAAPENAAQNDTSFHTLSFYGLFLHSTALMNGDIEFIITPAGVCHKASEFLIYDFADCIDVILECLPVHDIRFPQTLPGDNTYYAADTETVARFAQSAQQIIRDIGLRIADHESRRGIGPETLRLKTSLIDFRPEQFVDAQYSFLEAGFPQDLYKIVWDFVARFDGQCYDVVHRIKHFNASNSFAYSRHTMSSNQMRPGNAVPLKPSNLKNKKALWTTSDVSSESGSENIDEIYPSRRPIPFQSQPRVMEPEKQQSRGGQSHRIPSRSGMGSGSGNVLFGESGPYDEIGCSPKTSEDDEPQRYSPDEPSPHIEGVSIGSDGNSPNPEASSSRSSQGSSPLEEINAISIKLQTIYEPQCLKFQKKPPRDAMERKKLYDILSETILNDVVFKADAVNTINAEDAMLRVRKKQLIIDAQSALAQLDQVMGAS